MPALISFRYLKTKALKYNNIIGILFNTTQLLGFMSEIQI